MVNVVPISLAIKYARAPSLAIAALIAATVGPGKIIVALVTAIPVLAIAKSAVCTMGHLQIVEAGQ
jgi:hypothetical protein